MSNANELISLAAIRAIFSTHPAPAALCEAFEREVNGLPATDHALMANSAGAAAVRAQIDQLRQDLLAKLPR